MQKQIRSKWISLFQHDIGALSETARVVGECWSVSGLIYLLPTSQAVVSSAKRCILHTRIQVALPLCGGAQGFCSVLNCLPVFIINFF